MCTLPGIALISASRLRISSPCSAILSGTWARKRSYHSTAACRWPWRSSHRPMKRSVCGALLMSLAALNSASAAGVVARLVLLVALGVVLLGGGELRLRRRSRRLRLRPGARRLRQSERPCHDAREDLATQSHRSSFQGAASCASEHETRILEGRPRGLHPLPFQSACRSHADIRGTYFRALRTRGSPAEPPRSARAEAARERPSAR